MEEQIKLVDPDCLFAETYRSYVEEIRANGESFIPFCLGFEHEDFNSLVETLRNASHGIGIPPGFASSNTYWLINENREIVAVSNFRHYLTPALERRGGHIGYSVRPSLRGLGYGSAVLRETIKMARLTNLSKLLITCASTNLASIAVIKANGGVFEREDFLPEHNEHISYYWIGI